ncbi:MAG: TNT domain-containing protein [Actinomadura sp.]
MAQPGGRLRKARPFDGEGTDGRPYVSRPPVDADERDRLLAYLEKAPIALAEDEFEADRLDPAGSRDVPMTFHTDGTWIWPGAVGYYLRHHDVAPEPDLVEHVRGSDYRVPDVDIRTRVAAVSAITGVSLPAPAPVPASDRERLLREQAPGQASPGGEPQGPFEPLAGEPPLSLYRDRQVVELPVGAEVDRVGDIGGNVMYEARTPFENRSLPPEWVGRPYHVYRLQRPLRVLTGVAVPWFEQPGGGVAYVLPGSVRDLLSDGTLVEIPNA